MMPFVIITPWCVRAHRDKFVEKWNLKEPLPPWLILEEDVNLTGCDATKNRAMERVVKEGLAQVIILLDEDCFPDPDEPYRTLEEFALLHLKALEPQPVVLFESITEPRCRGYPYFEENRSVIMRVAASLGFWKGVPDYDAANQLVRGAHAPMTYRRETIFGRYFPVCGMNLAFRTSWWPWCRFVEKTRMWRFGDIWQGFIFLKAANLAGHCFNLAGPTVIHSRVSNIWVNLREESEFLEQNETIWRKIHEAPNFSEYADLLKYLHL